MDIVRFAAVGTGRITRHFLEAAQAVPSLCFVGVYSRDRARAEAFGAEFGAVKTWGSLEELAADTAVDAVYVASPNVCHCEQSILFLNAGKHVLCEKPAASHAREWARMCAAADRAGVYLTEAMLTPYLPAFQKLQEWLPRVGQVRQVHFHYSQYSSRYDNFKKGIVENAFCPALSNGALMDIGVYCAYALVALFGVPNKVLADAVFLENGLDGAGMVTAHYDGMQAHLTYSKINDGTGPSVILGESGAIEIDRMGGMTSLAFRGRDGTTEICPVPTHNNHLIYEAQDFARCVLTGDRPSLRAENTRKTLSLLDEIRAILGIHFPADNHD